MSNPEFLPWWAGAAGLATVAVLYFYSTGRFLGVSGLFDKTLHWKQTRDSDRVRAAIQASPDEWMQEMLAATRSAYGDQTAAPASGEPETAATSGNEPASIAPSPATAIESVVFLGAIPLGGLLAALLSGNWGESFSETLPRLFSSATLPVLFAGGVLVGFGTRMAGGCTSGHGLSGCSRFQPASLAATASFLGTAIAVSLILTKVFP